MNESKSFREISGFMCFGENEQICYMAPGIFYGSYIRNLEVLLLQVEVEILGTVSNMF